LLLFIKTLRHVRTIQKKSEAEKLEEKYQKLLKEAHALSTVNRKESDLKLAEANEVLKQIDTLQK
jgi:hypothetical protein